LLFWQVAPVQFQERNLAVWMDKLDRPGQTLPREGGSQHLVPLGHLLPGVLNDLKIKRALQNPVMLHDVNTRLWSQKRMEQQAFLQRRERIGILDWAALLFEQFAGGRIENAKVPAR